MSLKFLLDTNILSEPLRPAPNAKILRRLERHGAELATAAIVWHELWFGCLRLPPSAKREAIERYLTEVIAPTIPVLAYDTAVADCPAVERARLAELGLTPPFADGQMAAIASVNELTLVTLNTADYARFKHLQLTDWQST